MTAPTNHRTPTDDGPDDSTHRTVGRVEARNTREAGDDSRFDFDVDSDPHVDGLLGLSVSYLAAAATEQSAALDFSLDVSRIVLHVERPRARPDGGTKASGGLQSDAVESPDRTKTPDQAHSPTHTAETRVRATIEVRTDASAAQFDAWQKRLREDGLPSTITPELAALEIERSAR